MMSRRHFHQAIDRYIQGINDPFAPFNQPDFPHPFCEKCKDSEECLDATEWQPCEKVAKAMYEDMVEQFQMDNAMYRSWLLWEADPEKIDEDQLYDRIGLINIFSMVRRHETGQTVQDLWR